MVARGQPNSQVIIGRHRMAARGRQIVQRRLVNRVGKGQSEREGGWTALVMENSRRGGSWTVKLGETD